ncbi:hypothetical protein F4860DRAFT_484021 [Xylaria cubensis]|nr:hypothetical protein F4860DRAFT_484021 [Xylaria cubensis]
MQSPPTSDNGVEVNTVDLSRPFHGLVLCCTDIEADLRSQIDQRTTEMGGVHRYDLTPDVTHLIVGKYSTAKYRHVARERPDIKPMAAGWIEAVRRLWVEDQEMDMAALEDTWKLRAFESGGGIPNSINPAERERQRLVCCLTGFEDNNVRAMIEDTVKANGGEYVADLSRRVTHLIVARPEGKKYNAACRWGIHCISIEWLHDCVERGMILNEECYDPNLPAEERGKGAWVRRDFQRVALGKRGRDEVAASAEAGRRKLRKRASMRMNSQNNSIWGDILNQSAGDLSRPDDGQRESSAPAAPLVTDSITSARETPQPMAQSAVTSPTKNNWPALRKGVFSGCRFFVHGFPESKEQVLFGFLTSHGGQLASTLEDVASLSHAEPLNQRFLLVPQTSQPDSHPQLPDGVNIITEFFIERCIHNKTLFSPTDHVWGQPFPRFPIDGFQNLVICTAGFVNEQLNQIEKTVTQLGATYSEKLNRQVSLLVCPDLASLREQKRDLAIYHNIAIVDVEWLWHCITTGCLVPWDKFQFDELVRHADLIRANLRRKEEDKKKSLHRSRSEPVLRNPTVAKPSRQMPAPAPPPRAGVDMTAFDSNIPGADREATFLRKQDTAESQYETAPTHLRTFDDAFASAPLSETTASALNKPASPPKEPQPNRTLKRFPTEGEVGDSEAGEESDATPQTSMREPPPSDAEAENKRKAQQAKDLERRELSKRLNSLMADDTPQEGTTVPRPARRKRQILGRAASNASVTSTASVESASALSGPNKTRQLGSLSTSMGSEFDKFLEPTDEGDGADNNADTLLPPPSTQLGYEDPQANKHRQVVMGKMLGRNKLGGCEIAGNSKKQGQPQEKIRLADLDANRNISSTRRTTRRQGRQ